MLAIAWFLIGLFCAQATTVTVTSVADADIEEFHADSNFGQATSMACGELGSSANNELRRALLRFDLTGQIPPGAIINSVSVNMVVVRVSQFLVPSNFDLHLLLEPWGETAVTWNSRLASVPWQQGGAEGPADSVSTPSSSAFVSGIGPYTWSVSPALLSDVQGWIDNPSSNFGWLIVSEGEGTPFSACRFGTHEDPLNAPTLVIDYSLPGPVIQSQPQSRTVQVDSTATFSVSATGTPPLTYQWLLFGNPLPDQTNATLVLSNVQTNDAGEYSVVVSDQNGSTNSQIATLTITPLPVPQVSFLSPTNGARLPAQSQLLVSAQATEPGGSISQIELRLDGNSLGTSSNSPFILILTNPAPGLHFLTGVALDEFGTLASNSVSFSVFAPPTLALVQPGVGSTFPLGTTVSVAAAVSPGGAQVTNVAFLANGVLIGRTSTPPFAIQWRPAVAQPASLTAFALDEFGQSGTSSVLLVRIFVPESIPPTLTLTRSPTDFARLSSPLITLAGTARDDTGIERVEFQVNNGPFQPASGTKTWTAQVTLTPGLNTVSVRSVDLAGNTSALATRFFTLVVTTPVSLAVAGAGSITPDLNGRPLEIGQVFHVEARPAPGNIFAGWSGVSNANNPSLNFQMASNLTLVAHFVANPFPPLAGSYIGLFLDTNQVSPQSAGMILLRLDSQGRFTGTLAMKGARYPFHEQFSPSGNVAFPVLRRTQTPAVLSLQLQLGEGADQLFGFVTNAVGTNLLTSGLLARRNVFSLAHPAPQAGRRRFLLEQTPADGGAIVATASAKFGPAGSVQILGALTDGTSLSVSSALASDGSVPYYLSLKGGSGLLIGWLLFPNDPVVTASGTLFWVESGTNGFTRLLNLAPLGP